LTQSYAAAAGEPSIDITAQTVATWMADYESNDGFFSTPMWGKRGSIPWLLADEDIQSACRVWIQKHSPKKGTPNFTALDFKHFLVEDSRLTPQTTGYLNSRGPNGEPAISDCTQTSIGERQGLVLLRVSNPTPIQHQY
jgi:hypothetical protein